MTDAGELLAFINAQLAEDELGARAVDDNSPPWTGEWVVRETGALGTRNGWCLAYPHEGRSFAPGMVEHIVRHNPARALREVMGKRALVNVVSSMRHHTEEADTWYSCSQATAENGYAEDVCCSNDARAGSPCDCGLGTRQRLLLLPIAQAWAGEAGWREEWAA